MVTAYQVDPETGLIKILMTPGEVELTLALVMRGISPPDLRNSEITRLLKGWELVFENTVQGPPGEEKPLTP